jgi:hypothetical protein
MRAFMSEGESRLDAVVDAVDVPPLLVPEVEEVESEVSILSSALARAVASVCESEPELTALEMRWFISARGECAEKPVRDMSAIRELQKSSRRTEGAFGKLWSIWAKPRPS